MMYQRTEQGYTCQQSGVTGTGTTMRSSFRNCMIKLGYQSPVIEAFMTTTLVEVQQVARNLARARARKDYRDTKQFRNKYEITSDERKAYKFEALRLDPKAYRENHDD